MTHTGDSDRVTLITRLRTNNAGNEALSSALIHYFETHYPNHRLTAIERSPPALDGYALSRIQPEDVVSRFREFAAELLRKCHAVPPDLPTPPDTQMPVLQASWPLHQRIARRVRRDWPALEGLLAIRDYRRRLSLYQQSALVVANPAGEFDPAVCGDTPARLLLDLYVAKLAGARTAAINLSAEISDERLELIVRAVCPEFDVIITRDQPSRTALVELGVPADRIWVAPDAVFDLRPSPAGSLTDIGSRARRVGVALNPLNIHVNEETADRLLRQLLGRGYAVTAISNCWSVDKILWTPLAKRYPLEFQPGDLPYDSYVSYLAQFDYIISGRMHTNIFGMLADVPSIPLEGNLFRTVGLLGERGYPLPVIHLGSKDWQTDLDAALTQLEREGDAVRGRIAAYVGRQSAELRRVYASTLAPLIAHQPQPSGEA